MKSVNVKATLLCIICIVLLCGCSGSKGVSEPNTDSPSATERQTETSREDVHKEETTTWPKGERPTASLEPNGGMYDDTTEATKDNTTNTTTNKPVETTKPTETTEEVTIDEETTTVQDEEQETDVILDPFYMTKQEFSVYEMTYTRLQSYIKNNPGNILWTSEDPDVAQVANDELIAISGGRTSITGTSGQTSVTITVDVQGSEGSEEDSDIETDKVARRIFLMSERIYLFYDEGVVADEGIMDILENILGHIEEVTGYSYTDISNDIEYSDSRKRIVIQVLNSDEEVSYASTDVVVLGPDALALTECGAHHIVRQLIHMVQLRNGVDMGMALSEGYAEYLQSEVCKNLSYELKYDEFDEQYSRLVELGEITAEDIEYKLLYPEGSNPLSYFFAKYIAQTYGDSRLKDIADAITAKAIEMYEDVMAGQASLFTEEEILAIIEANTGEGLIEEFYLYLSSIDLDVDIEQ